MKKTGYNVECEVCGKIVYQTQTQYNRAIHHFCSNTCQMAFQRAATYEFRNCEVCGKEMYVRKKLPLRFCGDKCQCEWQKTQVGELNSRFTRQKINCEWCNKEVYKKKYQIEGDQRHFCSDKCRQEWYAKVYSQTEEWKDKSRIRAVNILENNLISHVNSNPQLIINKLLDSKNIKYENEKNYTYYAIDNYLSEYNLIIEIMGDFWHSNPIKYQTIKYDIQKKRIGKDKAKHSYIKNNYNIEILYLWEYDIVNNIDLCYLLIKSYIESKGVLSNYHSFNYDITDNKLNLIGNLIPYFSMKPDELSGFLVV